MQVNVPYIDPFLGKCKRLLGNCNSDGSLKRYATRSWRSSTSSCQKRTKHVAHSNKYRTNATCCVMYSILSQQEVSQIASKLRSEFNKNPHIAKWCKLHHVSFGTNKDIYSHHEPNVQPLIKQNQANQYLLVCLGLCYCLHAPSPLVHAETQLEQKPLKGCQFATCDILSRLNVTLSYKFHMGLVCLPNWCHQDKVGPKTSYSINGVK